MKITFNTAKIAKDKGYNIPTQGLYIIYESDYVYDDDPNHPESHRAGDITERTYYHINSDDEVYTFSSPSQSDLQGWLRDVHQIYIDVQTDCTCDPKFAYEINVFNGNPRDLSESGWGWYFHKQKDWRLYYKYEDALEEALVEGLSLIGKELIFNN